MIVVADTYFQDKCPSCSSTNLEYGSIEPEDEIIIQPVVCKDCEYEFQIYTIPSWHIRRNKEESS